MFPPVCLNCKKAIYDQKKWLCVECFDLLHLNDVCMCPECEARLPSYKQKCHTPYVLAPACFYHTPIPALVRAYKYEKLQDVERFLGVLLIMYCQRLDIDFDNYLITFVPLHSRKQRERGFNQARELARIVAQHFGTDFADTLKKVCYNSPQAREKDFVGRAKNVEGAYALKSGVDVKGKNVLVVDDISTSGATMREVARVLKEGGARNIIGLVVAKA